MTAAEIAKSQKKALHEAYKSFRSLLGSGFPRRGVQRSFEELVYSVIGKESWRPTHITQQALKEYVEETNKKIQRAHGTYRDRMDRFDRTLALLEGEEKEFNAWWEFFMYHDKTVLMTRKEHGSGKNPLESDLVPTPDLSLGYFENSGFNVKIRKKIEAVWMKEKYEEIFCENQEKRCS